MYLKRIEIAGFKSFANRTAIDFEKSVTAIVGPNGSGKSNITEAIRWVLGEQSAKSLRGGKMPDIIFAGSEARKALNIAEVTIVLDNQDHYLPLDFEEVSVTRRVSRSGDSEYFLNKQACRLKDIQELFMDSGLGKESFSIISQGKVEAIFSSKPEDRRGIFEEAAGVLKYKQRKKQAEQKIFETQDNLNRVQDIIYELEEQLAPLKIQSEEAKQFLALQETFTKKDVAYVMTEITQTKAVFDDVSQKLTQKKRQLEQRSQQMKVEEVKVEKLRQERNQQDETLEKLNARQLEVVEELKQTQGQQAVLEERAKHAQKSTSQYQDNLLEIAEKLTNLTHDKQEKMALLSQKNGEIQKIEKDLREQEVSLQKYQKNAKELIEELRSQYVDFMQQQANLGNDLKYLERQYQQETAQNQHLLAKQANLEAEQAKKEAQLAEITTALTEKQATLTQQRTQYQQEQARFKEHQSQFEQNQRKMYQLMKELQQVKARKKSLQEIQENYTGFYQGTRTILQNRSELTGIVGAVAELVQVPAAYTLAVETAFGAAAQHLIVETEKDARAGIQFLKQRQGGRGTFLPLTTIHARQIPASIIQQAQQVTGFIGVANELVQFDEKIQGVIGNLLGNTLITEDLESGNLLARKLQYRYRIVSLEGDVMHAGGSMTGGATKKGNQGNLFSQSHELHELTQSAQKLDQRLLVIEKQVQHFEQAMKESQQLLEEMRETGESQKALEQELRLKQAHLSEEVTRFTKELRILQYENQDLQEFLATYDEKKTETLEQQQAVNEKLNAINQEIKSLTTQEDSLAQRREILSEQVATGKAQLAVSKEQALHLREQITNLNATINETQERQQVIEQHLAMLSSDASDQGFSEEELKEKIAQLEKEKQTLLVTLQATREARSLIQANIRQKDQWLSKENESQQSLLSELTRLEVDYSRANDLLDQRLQYLQETYQLTYEGACQKYAPITELAQVKEQLQALRRQMSALEPVNLQAIEQFDVVKERYDFLSSQQDDLLAAKEQLFETMSEMDEEVKIRFKEVFDGICQQFKIVFPNMFGGGRAELILTNPDDLLNTGIEIEAQPPGKKLQNLSLLSGGERALTAIALLFSIIKVRPVPFCVLDEVEAALDEANVLRFGHYLRTFQTDTQFIVVTHRKGTMEAANVLYGVAMEESGVSKIVSVRLEQVAQDGKITV